MVTLLPVIVRRRDWSPCRTYHPANASGVRSSVVATSTCPLLASAARVAMADGASGRRREAVSLVPAQLEQLTLERGRGEPPDLRNGCQRGRSVVTALLRVPGVAAHIRGQERADIRP